MDSKRKNQKSKRGGSAASGKFADESASNERAGDGGGGFVGKMHINYSREDPELLVKAQDAAQKAMWQITGMMSNQGKDWFAAWRALLEKAGGRLHTTHRGESKGIEQQRRRIQRKAVLKIQRPRE
jgi:hypothetical protein